MMEWLFWFCVGVGLGGTLLGFVAFALTDSIAERYWQNQAIAHGAARFIPRKGKPAEFAWKDETDKEYEGPYEGPGEGR